MLFRDHDDLIQGFSIFLPDQEQPVLYSAACSAKLGGLKV